MAEPTEGALHEPAPLQHDEALLIRGLLDNAVTHAVQMAPLSAPIGGESAVEKGQAQAWPRRLAVIEGRQGVAILNVGGHDSQCQDVAFGIDQRYTFAPNQLLGPVVATRPAHPEALDALRVDDGEAGRRTTAAAATLSARQSAHQTLEQPLLDPAPEPAVDRAPVWKAGWQCPPRTAEQVPSDRCQHQPHWPCVRAARRICPLQEAGDLVQARLQHHALQARLMTRPMTIRPHLLSLPPRQAEFVFAHETDGDGWQRA